MIVVQHLVRVGVLNHYFMCNVANSIANVMVTGVNLNNLKVHDGF